MGALLALHLTGTDLSIVALIGIILLIGIVKKNAIMLVDFAIDAERNQGISSREAILKAAELRFRPIVMTTRPRRSSEPCRWCSGAGWARSCAARWGSAWWAGSS